MDVHLTPGRRMLAGLSVLISVALITGAAFGPSPSKEGPLHRISITVDGTTENIETGAATLAEALADAHITLGQDDKVFPDPSGPIVDGMSVRVMHITEKDLSFLERVPRQTIRKETTTLRPGYAKIADAGADGLRRNTYKVVYADGHKVLKELLSTQIIRKSRPRLVLYGKGSPLPSRGFYSRRVLTMMATAYDPGPRSCGKWATGRTAMGLRAGRGVVAVDPHVIRLGSKLYIEGYGFAIAGDTGGAIRGQRIDLGHDTYKAAERFGRRKVVVHVLE